MLLSIFVVLIYSSNIFDMHMSVDTLFRFVTSVFPVVSFGNFATCHIIASCLICYSMTFTIIRLLNVGFSSKTFSKI